LQGSKFTFKSHFEGLPWGMTNGYMLEVRFILILTTSNVLQGTLSPTMKNQGLFIQQSHQNIDGVDGNKVKMCASIMEFGKGGNNVHFISKHVYRCGFWVHTRSLGFWVRLGFAQGYKLCNKECKKMKQTWKKTTHKTKMVPNCEVFLHNHRKLHPCLL
jgi:hypothetical protein